MESDQGSHFKGHDAQGRAKVHDTGWRFHLSYNLQGLMGKNGILKQQIKLLTSEATLAGRTKERSKAFIHLKAKPVRPVAANTRVGMSPETPNTSKMWKSWETAIALTLTVDRPAMLLRTPSSILPGKDIIYWNLQ